MVQFNTLRLNGFKSFADRTEIDIGKGLTGVVGPNGCGKSNLVEALRWVMGESSSRRMRGGGSMEDVIFSGTSTRSSRNFAEVSLVLDNRGRTAPAEFNNSDEIEVVRRIERDKGSLYKINGKTVRARDVQMLFADIVVGANSPALVSQGRVTQMIAAKPVDRRKVLEESAGIAGLYARRHEAELRLRSADTNLGRIEDVTGAQENQLVNLKRQARQATKYKVLSDDIRQVETLLACLELTTAQETYETGRRIAQETEGLVASRMLTVTQLTKTELTQSEGLPELREKTNKASAAWQVQNITLQRLEDEEEQLAQSIAVLKESIENLIHDQKHEKEVGVENKVLLERLTNEEKRHHENQGKYQETIDSLFADRDGQAVKVQDLSIQYKTLLKTSAEQSAQKDSLERTLLKHREQLTECNGRIDALKDALSAHETNDDKENLEEKYTSEIESIEFALESLDAKEKELRGHRDAVDSTRDELHVSQSNARQEITSLDAEIRILKSFLENFVDGDHAPVLESIKAGDGMELALSRALGDTLQASLDTSSLKSWKSGAVDLKSLPKLPPNVQSLAEIVDAPEELTLALHMIGVAQTHEDAEIAYADLKVGQSIVTVNGEYLRWDGYRMKPEAKDPQSEFLQQKNMLEQLEGKLPKAQKMFDNVSSKIESIETDRVAYRQSLKDVHSTRDEAHRNLKAQQRILREYVEECSKNKEAVLKTKESLGFSLSRREELQAELVVIEVEFNALEKAILEDNSELDVEALKTNLDEEQECLNDLKVRYEQIQSENKRREIRLHAIVDERLNVNNKLIRATDQIAKFEAREKEAKQKLEDVKERPSDIIKEREIILNSISELQSRKEVFLEALNKAETDLRETTQALKEAEALLTSSKESRARAQATLEGAEQQVRSVKASIEDQFAMSIEDLLHASKAMIMDVLDKGSTSLEQLRRKKEALSLERERIGPVNLRADIEADEIEAGLTDLLKEKNELAQAIDELRSGIEKLNDEARERLAIAFERINAYFQSLFVNLFGGGMAYLKLVDSDDPLDAGLEIFAQPPGKSLQSLSLLSGGEQTLTSIALIFAMFLTNPSPICVLDEIDAPLDDANVDRVCDLVQDVARRGNTRFLMITHHRLTMARMDRLYGVTMAERGVSQLVSVDLQQQLDFLDIA